MDTKGKPRDLVDKADFLEDFFKAEKINMSVDIMGNHLIAKDDEGNQWKDAEIYDFALNECLAFYEDGTLSWGLATAESYVEQLKADAKDFGVEIKAFVNNEKQPVLLERIASAKERSEKSTPDPSKVEEREY